MVFRTALGWLIPLILSLNVMADEITLNPTHPNQYLVVEGDTLWAIAGKFLKNPAQWPKLWKTNRTIKNPDLIYPGDVLAFSVVDGKPQISVAQRSYSSASTNLNSHYEKWSPKIRESRIGEAITTIPASAIDQYLVSPKVVTDQELEAAPYVLTFAGEHLVAGAGDRVYVRSIPEPEYQNYTIYRKGHPYIDPETHELLGFEAEYIADAILQSPGDPATLLIKKSTSEIRSGDRLMPVSSNDQPLNYFPRSPEKAVDATIISVLGGVSQIGTHNIVVINKGSQAGIAVGHVLNIMQRGKLIKDPYSIDKEHPVQLPDEMAGELMIFRAFETVSYGLIMKASQPIHVLDKLQVP